MPLWRNGRPRKRWRYIGVYCDRVMLCAARVQVGPFPQSFWAIWDRDRSEARHRTRMMPGEVRLEGSTLLVESGEVRAEVQLGAGGEAIESICPSGEHGYAWTRKRAGIEVTGSIEIGERGWQVDGARGVDDQSAGYHRRHVEWAWSAGVGKDRDGREVAWNLVTGINDPPKASERAIWVDGRPTEPAPVVFDGLESIGFADGSRLCFAEEAERSREDNLLLVRSRYRHRFGSFSGSLGGIELSEGLGVMEEHSALW
ncbi:MAG: hypothetical protein ABR536_00910 [Solirubrobacterales bacterium]